MSLPGYVYKTLESVVGPENISERQHILAAYRHPAPGSPRSPYSPEAIILPGSTEEVQAIVKICNRHNIKYVAMTSLFSLGRASQPGLVVLNLQRMNRILEINETDRYAVVEPGVRHVQLKPETITYSTAPQE
jgi:FAD/FMN-containing dehydrogenase